MTKEKYKQAHCIRCELDNLYKMLYGFGYVQAVRINFLDITQRVNAADYDSMKFEISQELSDTIVKVIKDRIEMLEEQFKDI